MNNRLSIEYILGLINTDGSIYLDFKEDKSMPIKYALRPVLQISQQELNMHVLEKVKETLETYKVKSFISCTRGENKTRRSPRLKVEGIKNVRKCFDLFDKSKTTLFGLKLIDYLLLKEIYALIDSFLHNTKEGRQKVIDLKCHFHEPPVLPIELESNYIRRGVVKRQPKEKPSANRYSRETWEDKHEFDRGSTKEAGKSEISTVYQLYYQHCSQVLRGVKLHKEFVKGIFDGDGCIFNSSKTDVDCQFTFDNGNESLFLALADFFSDKEPCIYGRPGSQVYVIRREEIIKGCQLLFQDLLTHKRRISLPT